MLFNRIVSTAALRLSIFLSYRGSGEISRLLLIGKCGSDKLQSGWPSDHASEPAKEKISLADILNRASSFLPQVVLASKVLALIHPPSFTWFTNRYYAPALGFLMFAVGVNSREKDFLEAFSRPTFIISGYIGQFVVKPLLGYLLGTISMTIFGLPTSLGIACMDKYLPDNTSFQADGTRLRNDVVVMAPSISKASIIWPARRLYRKRHSYTTKSNQYHVVKTLGGTSVMNLERESKNSGGQVNTMKSIPSNNLRWRRFVFKLVELHIYLHMHMHHWCSLDEFIHISLFVLIRTRTTHAPLVYI